VNLLTARGLVYTYLGTIASDPAYPAATVTALLNAVANKYIADVQQMAPSYLRDTDTLAAAGATSRSYALPADFAGWLDVRVTDASGSPLSEVRDDELAVVADGCHFSITGPDSAATLTTDEGVSAGVALYLKYRYQPAEMSDDADAPDWMPTQFHDLLAREAAIDAFGLGDESAPSPLFLQETQDRRAQFWLHIGNRGIQPMTLR